jgi:hypothetical protein
MQPPSSPLVSALRGLNIAIVGGDVRDAQVSRLRRVFALRDVIHCTTRQTDASPRRFQSALLRPRIVLVIWLCGLSRTNHGKQLRAICRQLGLPWLDSPRIPHPHLLAARVAELHILEAIERRRALVLADASSGGAR